MIEIITILGQYAPFIAGFIILFSWTFYRISDNLCDFIAAKAEEQELVNELIAFDIAEREARLPKAIKPSCNS
jgi:hypothetical protein